MNVIHEHSFQKGTDLSDEDIRVLDVYGQLTDDDEPFDHSDLYLFWKEEFEPEDARCYVMKDEEDAVVAVANYQRHASDTDKSYLHTLVVDRQKRSLGLGAVMICFLLDKTKQDNRTAMRLEATDTSIGFYQRLGFAVEDGSNPRSVAMAKRV